MIVLSQVLDRFHARGGWWRVVAFLLILLPVVVVGTGCARHERTVSVESVLSEGDPDQEAWSVRLQIMENSLPKLTLAADYMARFESPDSTWMVLSRMDSSSRRVVVQIHDDAGGERARVRAGQVVYVETRRRFHATGGVVATTDEGRQVESEHLTWSESTGRVSTPGFATITTPTQVMSGWGLDADEALTDMRLSRVSGSVLPEERNP